MATTLDDIDWPLDGEMMAKVARIKVNDLGRDPHLLQRLAEELLEAARGRRDSLKLDRERDRGDCMPRSRDSQRARA